MVSFNSRAQKESQHVLADTEKDILHTLNAIHTQCSVGHEILKKNMLHVFVGQTDEFDEDNILLQRK